MCGGRLLTTFKLGMETRKLFSNSKQLRLVKKTFSSGIFLGLVLGVCLLYCYDRALLEPDVIVVISNNSGQQVTDLKVEFTDDLYAVRALSDKDTATFMAVTGYTTGIDISYSDPNHLTHKGGRYFEYGYGFNTLRYSIGPDFELKDLGGDFFERSGLKGFFHSLSELTTSKRTADR